MKRYIVRTLAAAAVSLAAKLVIKKIQSNKADNEEKQQTSVKTGHPPHST